eukprot:tig00000796_g4234.t1
MAGADAGTSAESAGDDAAIALLRELLPAGLAEAELRGLLRAHGSAQAAADAFFSSSARTAANASPTQARSASSPASKSPASAAAAARSKGKAAKSAGAPQRSIASFFAPRAATSAQSKAPAPASSQAAQAAAAAAAAAAASSSSQPQQTSTAGRAAGAAASPVIDLESDSEEAPDAAPAPAASARGKPGAAAAAAAPPPHSKPAGDPEPPPSKRARGEASAPAPGGSGALALVDLEGGAGAAGASGADAGPEGYEPARDAAWPPGAPVPYAHVARTFAAVEATSSRNRIAELLADMFRAVLARTPTDLLAVVYLAVNRIAPDYAGEAVSTTGIGGGTLAGALAEATGRTPAAIKQSFDALGDLGDVALASRATQRTLYQPPPLTAAGLLGELRALAATRGAGSGAGKRARVKRLLAACRGVEIKRAPVRHAGSGGGPPHRSDDSLRRGRPRPCLCARPAPAGAGPAGAAPLRVCAEEAAARGGRGAGSAGGLLEGRLEEGARALRRAYNEHPNWDDIVSALLLGAEEQSEEDWGWRALSGLAGRVRLGPGVPARCMLARPSRGLEEVLERFRGAPFLAEFKYDGQRAQVHRLPDGSVRIFSRHLEETTGRFPEVAALFAGDDPPALAPGPGGRPPGPLILDAEVCLFAFDVLYAGEGPATGRPLRARREALRGILRDIPSACEGLMCKALDDGAAYGPAERSDSWLKLKRDYIEGLADSFDLVPIGAFHGTGRRAGWYSPVLLACYDPESEKFQAMCKCMTGFTDAFFERRFRAVVLLRGRASVRGLARYDVDLDCGESARGLAPLDGLHGRILRAVWEVRGADLTVSPVHVAARGLAEPGRGLSLRFPRFLRLREDRAVEEATSARQVAELYRRQGAVANEAARRRRHREGGDDDEEEL